jgi:pyruvate dehydrogenase E1 component
VRNLWWVVDYNRQSLDAVVSDRLFGRIDALFEMFGWRVVTLKYGHLLQAAFARPDGAQLREWIDSCPNSLYSALVYKGGEGWREHLRRDLNRYPGIRAILEEHDDDALARLMTNLAGHDMGSVLEAFHGVTDDQPTCFIAYTIKGYGLPFAGHKDNHAGLMNPQQMALFQERMAVAQGEEWEPFAGLDRPPDELAEFLAGVPLARGGGRRHETAAIPVPAALPVPRGRSLSTQEAFGRILGGLASGDSALASRIVTTSPDVTVSTNLGAWVNRRGIFDRAERADTFREERVVSAQRWAMGPEGQHIELGIAEHNLFLTLAALGLAGPLFGARLLPIGTIYDPFIKRGLDALNYALYQDARFILVATPSGITLAPEGGAHQSVVEPLIAGLRRRTRDPLALGIGRNPAPGARRRRIGLFPAVDAPLGAAGARARCGIRREGHRGGLLAARTRPGCRAGDRLLRCGRTRGDRRLRGDPRGFARHRAVGDHLARPLAPRLAHRARGGEARHRRAPPRAAAAGRCTRHRLRQPSRDPLLARRRQP